MGHDIYAFRQGDEQEDFAYLRRSAGDPMNQAIYLALGVYDDAYCGCSGCGKTLSISRQQLETAVELLRKKSFVGMTMPRNVVHDIADRLGFDAAIPVGDCDAAREIDFLVKCLDYLTESGRDSLEINFS